MDAGDIVFSRVDSTDIRPLIRVEECPGRRNGHGGLATGVGVFWRQLFNQ